MTSKLIICACLLMAVACQTEDASVQVEDYILTEKDLIPEGVAFDDRSGTIYVGSTYRRKIVQIDAYGGIRDFVPQEFEGIWSPVGMEVDPDNNLLWVNTAHANEVMPLIHPDTTRDFMTNLSAFSLEDGTLKHKYSLVTDTTAFLNDLTKFADRIYVTESIHSKLYVLDSEQGKLELFMDLPEYHFPNGITADVENELLFVSTLEGVVRVDLASRQTQLLEIPAKADVRGIDGLTLHRDALIAHLRDGISLLHLDDERTRITHLEVLDSGDEFDASTTGEVGDGHYYYIVNSQINSGVDYSTRSVKPRDSLENVIIRRTKL